MASKSGEADGIPWGGRRPSRVSCSCQDAGTHPKIAEASIHDREVYQGDTFVTDPLS